MHWSRYEDAGGPNEKLQQFSLIAYSIFGSTGHFTMTNRAETSLHTAAEWIKHPNHSTANKSMPQRQHANNKQCVCAWRRVESATKEREAQASSLPFANAICREAIRSIRGGSGFFFGQCRLLVQHRSDDQHKILSQIITRLIVEYLNMLIRLECLLVPEQHSSHRMCCICLVLESDTTRHTRPKFWMNIVLSAKCNLPTKQRIRIHELAQCVCYLHRCHSHTLPRRHANIGIQTTHTIAK